MPMYQLTPTFPADFDVHPKKGMYRVAPYHNIPSNSSGNVKSQEQNETDPVKVLERKQNELIAKLKAQSESFNKILVSLKKVGGEETKKVAAAAPQKTEKKGKEATPVPEKDGKKDKDAKKEARKAAKTEAKNKVATGDAPASKGKSQQSTSSGAKWTVQDDRKTWETGLSLTVNIPTSLVDYPQEHLGKTTLTVTESSECWVKILAAVGQKRSVAFTGHISNKTGKDAKTTVNVVKGNENTLSFEKTTVKSLPTIWKLLGASLGLFSRKAAQTLSASHQSLWLNKADQILRGTVDISFAEREASQFLARFDSLSSQWEVTVADVVFRSLVKSSSSHPNNVEIWAAKIDKVLA